MFSGAKGKFYVRIEASFESSHYLYRYYPDGTDEKNHGHSWKVEIYLSGNENISEDGISFDFLRVRNKLDELQKSIDHILINDHPDFSGVNPTSENIARWFYLRLIEDVKNSDGKIQKIVVHEGPFNLAFFEPESD